MIIPVLCLGFAQFYHLSCLLVPKLLFTDNGCVHMDLPLNNSAGDLRLAERGVAVYGTVAEWQGQFLTLSKAACHYIEDSVDVILPHLLYPSLKRGRKKKGDRHTHRILGPTHNC